MSVISIFVSWGDVLKFFVNGVFFGYYVFCKVVKFLDSYFVEFLFEEYYWELKGFKIFVNYSCWLRVYNNYGNGSWSEELVILIDDVGMLFIGSCGYLLMSCKFIII